MIHLSTRSLGVRSCDPTPLLAFLLPVFAWAPLTYPGYLTFRSGFLSVFNLTDLLTNLGDWGWAPSVGVAYDLLSGERSLPYLIGAVPSALGATPATATKCVFALSLLAASVGMYGWSRRWLGNWPALVAATIYCYSPIIIATIYGRGAFAESVLYGLTPWILWSAEVFLRGKRLAAIGLALGVAAAMWTQTGLALWLVAIVVGYVLTCTHQDVIYGSRGWQACLAILAGVVTGVLGLLPTLLSRGFGGGVHADLFDHFMGLYEILGMPEAGMAPGLGLGVVAASLAIFAFLLPSPSFSQGPVEATQRSELRRARNYALVVVVLLVFQSTSLSTPLWRVLPFLAKTLTYPWQLLLLASPWLAFLAGIGARRLEALLSPRGPANASVPLFAGVVVLVLLGTYTDLRPGTTAEPVGRGPLAIFGDNEIALLSVKTDGVPGPGSHVLLEAQWQALRPVAHDYTVFFHVVAENGERYAQHDGMPQDGQLPTSRWLPGEIVTDQYETVLSADAPRDSDYRYWLGWYLGESGERLAVNEDDKYVITP